MAYECIDRHVDNGKGTKLHFIIKIAIDKIVIHLKNYKSRVIKLQMS